MKLNPGTKIRDNDPRAKRTGTVVEWHGVRHVLVRWHPSGRTTMVDVGAIHDDDGKARRSGYSVVEEDQSDEIAAALRKAAADAREDERLRCLYLVRYYFDANERLDEPCEQTRDALLDLAHEILTTFDEVTQDDRDSVRGWVPR